VNGLKPKQQHEQLLADADKVKIVQYLNSGRDQDVTKISVTLAHKCDLFVHYQRLWKMRVSGLDETLSTERYMKDIYSNKRALYKELVATAPPS
jgi:hypothetical protein